MAEGKKGRKLGRQKGHRKALMSNLVKSLFQYEQITTTEAKAKELRRVAEKLITMAKKNNLASRRVVNGILNNKEILKKLFDNIAPRFKDRKGGYTSIVKMGQRKGDGAHQANIRLL